MENTLLYSYLVGQSRDDQADEPVFREPGKALPVEASRDKIARGQEQHPHEVCLLERQVKGEPDRGHHIGGCAFCVVPAAEAAVGYRQVGLTTKATIVILRLSKYRSLSRTFPGSFTSGRSANR